MKKDLMSKYKGLSVVMFDNKIEKVKLPFSADDWIDIADPEGDLLPSCCAAISEIRSVLLRCLSDGQYITCTELCEIYVLIKDHGCDEDCILNDLIEIWEEIKDKALTESSTKGLNPDDLNDAIRIMSDAVTTINFNQMFQKEYQSEVIELNQLRILFPAIRTIYQEIQNKFGEFVKGYAIVDKENNVVPTRVGGLGIYEKKSTAEQGIKQAFKGSTDYSVRKVKLSIEGIDFL